MDFPLDSPPPLSLFFFVFYNGCGLIVLGIVFGSHKTVYEVRMRKKERKIDRFARIFIFFDVDPQIFFVARENVD